MKQEAPEHIVRLFGLPEPHAYAGCSRCGTLDADRKEARVIGDLSRVTDCNVLLRQHRTERHQR